MMAVLLACPRGDGETIDSFCRRRLRNARNVCMESGMWSMIWCQRIVDWDAHIHRGARYNHICSTLLNHKNSLWLRMQRSAWVPEDSNDSGGGRLSTTSGRTGTRANIGRPQVRWEQGVANAKSILSARTKSQSGGNALTIGTIIFNACSRARVYAEQYRHTIIPQTSGESGSS